MINVVWSYEGQDHVVKGSDQWRDVYGRLVPSTWGKTESWKWCNMRWSFEKITIFLKLWWWLQAMKRGGGGHLDKTEKLNLSAAEMFWCLIFLKVHQTGHLPGARWKKRDTGTSAEWKVKALHTVFYSRLSDPAQKTSIVNMESKSITTSTMNVPLTRN